MIFDMDIIIWIERGNPKAAKLVDEAKERFISILTYMELLQCAKSQKQHKVTRDFLLKLDFQILPLTENIGHRASIYIEEYALSYGIRAADALIAATAVEHNLVLASGNAKHFKAIKDLQFKIFRP